MRIAPASLVNVLLLALVLGAPPAALAQGLVCRAGGVSAGPAIAGPLEVWPTLTSEFFVGPDARSTLLADGSAVIVDRAKDDLVLVDHASGRVTILAHKGEGPGEIKSVAGLAANGADAVTVIDLGNHRITSLSRTGQVRTSFPFRFSGVQAFVGQLGPDLIEVTRNRGEFGKAQTISFTIRALRPDSAVTLKVVELPDPASVPGIFTATGTAAVVDASHLALASGASPAVTVVGLGGAADRVVKLDLGEPLPTSHDMAERLITLASTQIPAAQRSEVVSMMLQKVPLDPYYPMFTRLIVGTAGHWWVQRTYTGEARDTVGPPSTFSMNDLGGSVFQQFDAKGARGAECAVPADWRVLGAGHGWILFAKDEADNTRLFSWRVK